MKGQMILARFLRDKVETARARYERWQMSADCFKQELEHAEHELREVVAFLAEHNSEDYDWWAEVGLTPNCVSETQGQSTMRNATRFGIVRGIGIDSDAVFKRLSESDS